ncbi:hypothetical protein JJB99_00555 [Bradyrhizobium diazoefficiens]|uniref:hypothetical protein n=1 Tax=Bradyrhizobium diazoefficiens TaxID=1355477 RepID=UPI00190CE74B|nr:hypothetical protein [Bradyrhizobium diazoefficiens]QQO14730.1 hypothetical protein JJB99_00555 [Bradyrhizobium diazoefficiens]
MSAWALTTHVQAQGLAAPLARLSASVRRLTAVSPFSTRVVGAMPTSLRSIETTTFGPPGVAVTDWTLPTLRNHQSGHARLQVKLS